VLALITAAVGLCLAGLIATPAAASLPHVDVSYDSVVYVYDGDTNHAYPPAVDATQFEWQRLAQSPRNGISATLFGDTARDSLDVVAPKSIPTPYGAADQGLDAASVAARSQVESGSTMYRIGTTGRSAGPEGQFCSLEHPSAQGYASRYGLPAENVANADFIESAVVTPGSPFITRAAPGIGDNVGGGIEVVVKPGGVTMCGFSYLGPKGC